jgi:subtilisin-like proprotein convertase family protein
MPILRRPNVSSRKKRLSFLGWRGPITRAHRPRRLLLEQVEERAMLSFVQGLGLLDYFALPGEENDVTITPGVLTNVTDNPNISLLSTCPSAEFLRGLSFSVGVSFIASAEASFPLIPFDLPDNGVICPTAAGFQSLFATALQNAASGGSASVVAGAAIPSDGDLYFKVTANGDDPITNYKLFHVIADGSLTHADTAGDLDSDSSVFRSASPGTGRVITGNVAGSELDRFSFDAKAGKKYVVMLDQNPEQGQPNDDGKITSTRLTARTIPQLVFNTAPLAQNISVVGGNAIGPFTVGSDQKVILDVQNAGVGADTSYRFVVAEYDDADSVSQPEGPQTIAATDTPLAIPDANSGNTTPGVATSTLNVANLTGTITDVSVKLNITHTFDSDLKVTLISPTGTRVKLFEGVGSSGDNFNNTAFDDSFSFNPIDSGAADFNSTFSPEEALSTLNGQTANGAWKLEVVDEAHQDTGTLNSWSITVTTNGNSDTKANATTLAAGKFADAAVDPARDVDFWRHASLTTGGLVFAYVDTSASTKNKDSQLALSMNNADTFAQADDGGPPGITDQQISDLKKQFQKAGFQTGGPSTFSTVNLHLGDLDDRADLSALQSPTTVFGEDGMDTVIGGQDSDTIDGGKDADTIDGRDGDNTLIGGPGDDTFIVSGLHDHTDTVYGGDPSNADIIGSDTLLVPPSPTSDDFSICVNHASPTPQAIIKVGQVTTSYVIPNRDIDDIQVSGGDGNDSLHFNICGASGLPDDQVVVYVRGPQPGSGAIYVVDSSGNPIEPPVTFDDIENVDFLGGALTRADGSSRLVVMSDQSFEKGANDTTNLATHLGAGGAVNLDPAIFPAGDVDDFQFVAQYTGTLDFHVLFQQNAALPGNGDLSVEVRDANSNLIAIGTASADGKHVTIPAVKDQVYFLRVAGATGPSINDYDVTAINTPAPVPTGVVLDQADDSGPTDLDQVTFRTTQLHYFVHADLSKIAGEGVAILTPAQATAGVTPGAAVQVFNEGVSVGFATAVAGANNSIFEIDVDANLAKFPNRGANAAGPVGYDGFVNFLTAAVTIFDGQHDATNAPTPAVGLSLLSNSLSVTADNTAPFAPSTPDLLPSSDSGQFNDDNVTLFNALALQGTGEANTHIVIRANGLVVGEGTVGTDATDGVLGNGLGTWEITTEPLTPASTSYVITAQLEDLAGNIGPVSQALHVLIDPEGPQVTDVFITGHGPNDPVPYNLFGQKPGNASDGPTPAVNSLTIRLQDLPAREAAYFANYLALNPGASAVPGSFVLTGDATGIVAISSISLTNDPVVDGQPATATIKLQFTGPLLDDRYTLTINDSVVDPAGNPLDGESNAAEPNGGPTFASGNGLPGSDFVARFTVDSRPEIGNYSAGSAFIDINGNYVIDAQGNAGDVTNRDLSFQIGTVSDSLFAGKFEPANAALNDNDGFDKLGAYGYDNSAKKYRFLLDFNHDGISDQRIVSAFQVNGTPVAGNFVAGRNGDEIGLFDGQNWYLDNVGDNQLHVKIVSNMRGQPIVGDFNGDGKDDLATYDAKTNTFYFDINRDGQTDDTIVFTGPLNGQTESPVAGDLNLDGIDDLGLRVSNRQGSPTPNVAEWYFVLSDHVGQTLPHNVFNTYAPSPLGNDLFAQFGDYFSLPVFGNFDPPIGAGSDSTSQTNSLIALDVNNDGVVSPGDVLTIINLINAGPQFANVAAAGSSVYPDVDGDHYITPSDVLQVINFLNSRPSGSASADAGEGESVDAALAQGGYSSVNAVTDDLLALLAAESPLSKSRR